MKNISSVIFALIILFSFISDKTYSQDTVKIMTYNLLNYNGSIVKDQNFRKTVKYVNPDILVCEEVISQSAVNNMLANIMNYYTPGIYSAGTFLNGPDTDNSVFYKSSKFIFLYNQAIPTTLRTINLFVLKHIASGDTIRLFAVHLKAGNNSGDSTQRLSEVNTLRTVTNVYPAGTEFAVMGDFNIYRSTEPAYQKLLQIQSGNEGHFTDPLSMPGLWNQAAFAQYHTQSTRTRNLNDSGATGGLDDRFDMILNSKGLNEEGKIKYIPGSLKPIGNDGSHYNDSINKRPNSSVPDSISDALYYGSDHLPVVSLYKFDNYNKTLYLTSLLEGSYNTVTNRLSRRDTITVYLRNAVSPYQKTDSAKAVIDSVNFMGQFSFTNTLPGSYYIVADHFNSIETWSRSGGENMFSGSQNYSYDFTSGASKAFGNNLVLKGTKYCIYSGDTNKDGVVDASDLSAVDNDALSGYSGRFLISDLNCDDVVDGADISVADNNSFANVSSVKP